MSKQIDERVVSMKFDNKDFEKNAATSMSTLDKLKDSLNLDSLTKNLGKLSDASNKVDMSGMGRGIDQIQAKFSALDVVGMTVISNLTTAAMNMASKMYSAVTAPFVDGGKTRALNIEQAKFQFKGLGMDVEATMADASYAVDGTAYSLDAAAKVASQLGASGMRAGDQMKSSLRAISGVAAMAGSSYEDIGNVFTKVSGQGRLMGDDLLRLSSRGINAAATIAKEMGVTEEAVRDMVTKGQIDFLTFSAAMDSAFGQHAKAANQTFTGSLSNMKSAISRMGERVYTPFFSSMIEPLNAVREKLNQTSVHLNTFFTHLGAWMARTSIWAVPFIKSLDLSWMEPMGVIAIHLIHSIRSAVLPLGKAFQEVFNIKWGDTLKSFLWDISKFTEKFRLTGKSAENLTTIFKGFFALLKSGGTILHTVFSVLGSVLKIFSPFGTILVDAAVALSKFSIHLSELLEKSQVLKTIRDKAGEMSDFIVDKLNQLINKIRELFAMAKPYMTSFSKSLDKIKDSAQKMAEGALPTIKRFGKDGREMFASLSKEISSKTLPSFDSVNDKIPEMGNNLKVVKADAGIAFKSIGDGLASFGKKVTEALSGITLSDVIDVIKTGLSVGIGAQLFGFLKNTKEVVKSIQAIPDSISTLLGQVGDTLEVFQNQVKSKILMEIAKAVAILAASLLVLSLIDPSKMASALAGLSVIFLELAVVMKVMTKTLDDFDPSGMGKTVGFMLAMSVAVLVLASALTKLSDLDWDELGRGLAGLAGVFALLFGTFKMLDKYGDALQKEGVAGKLIVMAGSLIALGFALKIIAGAVKIFGELDTNSLIHGIGSVMILLLGLTTFFKYGNFGDIKLSTALAILALAASLKTIAKAVEALGSLDTMVLVKGLSAVAIALIAFTASVKLMPNDVGAKSVSLTIMAASLLILKIAIEQIGTMDADIIANGLTRIANALGILVLAMNLIPSNARVGSLIAMGAALMLLVVPIKMLGSMSVKTIATGLITMALALGILIGAAYLAAPVAVAIQALAMALLTMNLSFALAGFAVAGFVTALVALVGIGTAGITVLVATLTALMSIMPMFFEALGESVGAFFKGLGKAADGLADGLIMIIEAAVRAIVVSAPVIAEGILQLLLKGLELLVQYGPAIIDKLMSFLIIVIDGLAAKMPSLVKSVINLFRKFFESVAKELKAIPTDSLIDMGLGFGIMAGLMVVCASLAALAIPAMVGVLALGLFVAELSLVLAALGALNQIPGLQWLINEGGELLGSVGTAIGKFVGGFVGGILEGITGRLPQMATDLSQFMDNLQPFLEGAKNIDESVANGMLSLSKAILALTAANVLDGLTSWLTGGVDIAAFGKEIAAFAPSLKEFADKTTGITGESVKGAADAALALAQFAAEVPNQGGALGALVGENSLSEFGKEIAKFAPSLKEFADKTTGITGESVKGAVDAAIAIIGFADTIPNQGGALGALIGDNTLSKFGEELAKFGPGLSSFASETENVKVEPIKASSEALISLAEAATHIANSGGLAALFAGDNSLGDFGTELVLFGQKLQAYSEALKDTSLDSISNSAVIITDFVRIQKSLSEIDTKDTGISEFGNMLVQLSTAIKNMYNGLEGINPETLSSVITSIGRIRTLIDSLVGLDTSGVANFQTAIETLGQTSLDSLVTAFEVGAERAVAAATALMTALSTGIQQASGMVGSSILLVITAALAMAMVQTIMFQTTGMLYMTSMITGIQAAGSAVTPVTMTIITAALSAIRSRVGEFVSAGRQLMQGLATGIRSEAGSIRDAASSTLNGAADSVRAYYDDFYSAGSYVASGFANGIRSGQYLASSAGSSLGKAAYDAAKAALDEHSPSRKMFEVGDFAVMGLVNALLVGVKKVWNAGTDLGEAVLNTTNDAISNISTLDMSPVITPILDLTDVQSGFSNLDSMLASRTVGLAYAANGSMSSYQGTVMDRFADKMQSTFKDLVNHQETESRNKVYVLESHMNLDGREFARGTVRYTQEELDRLEKINARKAGNA